MKRFFILSIICMTAFALSAQEFVDLGLPSGTKWKEKNESDLFNFTAARSEFGKSLPTYAQFEELKDQCKWVWTGKGYTVTGPNGSSIFLPATEGIRDCDGEWMFNNGIPSGSYWTSSQVGAESAWLLNFSVNMVNFGESQRCFWRSVRLVQN